MRSHLLKGLWIGLLTCLVGGYGVLSVASGVGRWRVWMGLSLLALGLALLGYLTLRAVAFHRRLQLYVRHLLAGNYDAGVPASPLVHDELSTLERMLNKFTAQLREYDALRAERVRYAQRLSDAILQAVDQPVMIFNRARQTLRLNPAWQALFSTDQRDVGLGILKNIDANREFLHLLEEAAAQGTLSKGDNIAIHWPTRDTRRHLKVHVIPIKDRNEKVGHVAVIGIPATTELLDSAAPVPPEKTHDEKEENVSINSPV